MDEFEPQIRKVLNQNSKFRLNYPYWRLQNDKVKVWDIRSEEWEGSKDPPKTFLENSEAGLPESIYRKIRNNPILGHEIIFQLLDQFIPEYFHIDILAATKLTYDYLSEEESEDRGYYQSFSRKLRDYKFRKKVLPEYQYMCAVCNLSIKFNNQFPALEAAHIKAVQYNGPNIVSNGLSLCSNHHTLFDRGTFTIVPKSNKFIVEVSERVMDEGLNKLLSPYNSCPIVLPQNHFNNPKLEYLEWHREHVFQRNGHPTF